MGVIGDSRRQPRHDKTSLFKVFGTHSLLPPDPYKLRRVDTEVFDLDHVLFVKSNLRCRHKRPAQSLGLVYEQLDVRERIILGTGAVANLEKTEPAFEDDSVCSPVRVRMEAHGVDIVTDLAIECECALLFLGDRLK